MLGITGAAINAIQTTLYALAAHVYPTAVRATGVGTAVAFGRIGGVMSSYAGEWALGAGGSARSSRSWPAPWLSSSSAWRSSAARAATDRCVDSQLADSRSSSR